MSKVRTRFAPSPTGALHVGGARTALFNYLFAKHHGGEFMLRIEDTDQTRSSDEYVQTILDGLNWLGLKHDGDIVVQSSRVKIYNDIANNLLNKYGYAFKDYNTSEEIAELKAKTGVPFYDLAWAKTTGEGPYVIRFGCLDPNKRVKTEYVVDDMIHGKVKFNSDQVYADGHILIKSDGMPAYNFACVVDDYLLGITHVFRGDDHLSNTPIQVAIYQAMEWTPPKFGHLPMILGPDKKKLSKRHGATSVFEYKDMGILPEAMINHLARLGWSNGNQELFNLDELIAAFDGTNINKTPCVFDMRKLTWFNTQHLINFDIISLDCFAQFSETQRKQLESIIRPRAHSLTDIYDLVCMFNQHYKPSIRLDNLLKAVKGTFVPSDVLTDLLEAYRDVSDNDWINSVQTVTEAELAKHNLVMKDVNGLLRVVMFGDNSSPATIDCIKSLSKDVMCTRLQAAVSVLEVIPC